jgi:hypothetical protein
MNLLGNIFEGKSGDDKVGVDKGPENPILGKLGEGSFVLSIEPL